MKFKFSIFFSIFLYILVNGQKIINTKTIFYKDSNGVYGNIEPTDIIRTNDNYYIISSKIRYKCDIKSSLTKLNSSLDTIWNMEFDDRYIKSITKDSFNNYYISGSLIVKNSIWIAKISSEGNIIWKKTYKIGLNKNSYMTNVVKLKINNNSDLFLLGSKGQIKFVKFYGRDYPLFHRIRFFADNFQDIPFIFAFDKNGNRKWKKVLKKQTGYKANDISINNNNKIFIISEKLIYIKKYNNSYGYSFLVKVNPKGKTEFIKKLEKKSFFLHNYNDKLICTGFFDDAIGINQFDNKGNLISEQKMIKYQTNRQFFSEWTTGNKDKGIIWLQNNKIILIEIKDDGTISWKKLNFLTKFMQLKGVSENLNGGIVLIGYRYKETSFGLIKYIEMIELN